MNIARLNLGCGPTRPAGWINADRRAAPDIHLAVDVCDGLPVADDAFDYVTAMHLLQDLPYLEVPVALKEVHRVLKPHGVLRVGVPDLDRAIRAYLEGNAAYFYVPDSDARTVGGKLVAQIIWYGSVRTPFTFDGLEEFLDRAGFVRITRCGFRETASAYPEIVELDNRERETLFVEAVK